MTSRMLHRALFGASTFALAALAAAPASAQRVDSITAFGDSYADDGNALQLGLISPALQPLYPTGRFTGGTNYVDTLGQILNVPIDNFAIGGARANPDFLFEVNTFLAGGGGVFPTVDGSFDANDLVTVSIGGNDARAFGSTPGASVAGAPAAAAPAIAAATTGLNALVAAGAPTISFVAGDTGRLPEVASLPSIAAIRTAFSTAFNTGMQDVLAGYAANGVMVHYLDLSLVLDQVQADLAAYGLTGLVCPAFTVSTACVATGGQGFLFYGDLLHPTSQGSAIFAQYIATQLTAPLTLSAPSELGLNAAQQFGRTLTGRMDLGAPRDGDMSQGIKFFVTGDAFMRDVDATRTNDEFSVNSAGATVGAHYGFGNGVVGIAANYSRPEAEFGNDAAGVDGDTMQVGAFAGMAVGPVFAQGYVGYGKDDYDITRRGVVDPMSADPDGSHWIAGAKAGYLTLVGPVRAGPVVAVDYAKAKVDGYTEEGDPALTLNVDEIDHDSLRGSIGAEVRGDFAPGDVQIRPYGALVLEKELSGGDRAIRFAQTASPGIVNRFDYERTSRDPYARFSAGGSALINSAISMDAGVSTTFGKDQGNETSGHVALKIGL